MSITSTADVRNLSDDDLFRKRAGSLSGSDARSPLDTELERRVFLASQQAGKTAGRIVWLTVALVGTGILQAVATGWPYLSWWIRNQTWFR